jgi:hypothetical protein
MPLSRSILFMALATLPSMASSAYAVDEKNHDSNLSCNIQSDFQPGMKGQAFVFTQEEGSPGKIAIGGGRLFFDGQEAKLNAADKAHIADLEKQMRQLTPEVQAIAVEAVDIAFSALIETSKALAPEDKKLQTNLANARVESKKKLNTHDFFIHDKNTTDDVIEATIAPIIGEYISVIAGNAVNTAISMAFGGEVKAKEFEARMKAMEARLDKEVKTRAKALEPRVESFCLGMENLDKTENKISYRFPNGKALELFQVSKH